MPARQTATALGDSSPAPQAGRLGWRLRTAVELLLTDLALVTLGFKRTYRAMARWGRPAAGTQGPEAHRHEVEGLVAAIAHVNASFSLYRARCLPVSLVGWSALRRHGIRTELRLGVRTLGGRFESHSWLEWQGAPLGESGDVAALYATLDLTPLLPRPA